MAVVHVFLKYVLLLSLSLAKAPGLSGGRGEMALAVASFARPALFRGAVCAFAAVHQTWSLGPCTVTVSGAASHNRGRVAETPLLAMTQSRTADCTLTSRERELVSASLVARLRPFWAMRQAAL